MVSSVLAVFLWHTTCLRYARCEVGLSSMYVGTPKAQQTLRYVVEQLNRLSLLSYLEVVYHGERAGGIDRRYQ